MTRILAATIFLWGILLVGILLAAATPAFAEPRVASYIFPAGGQRGSSLAAEGGGMYLTDACNFDLRGAGVAASRRIVRTDTVWFEGPPMARPASPQAEKYQQDFAST